MSGRDNEVGRYDLLKEYRRQEDEKCAQEALHELQRSAEEAVRASEEIRRREEEQAVRSDPDVISERQLPHSQDQHQPGSQRPENSEDHGSIPAYSSFQLSPEFEPNRSRLSEDQHRSHIEDTRGRCESAANALRSANRDAYMKEHHPNEFRRVMNERAARAEREEIGSHLRLGMGVQGTSVRQDEHPREVQSTDTQKQPTASPRAVCADEARSPGETCEDLAQVGPPTLLTPEQRQAYAAQAREEKEAALPPEKETARNDAQPGPPLQEVTDRKATQKPTELSDRKVELNSREAKRRAFYDALVENCGAARERGDDGGGRER